MVAGLPQTVVFGSNGGHISPVELRDSRRLGMTMKKRFEEDFFLG
jgi:hypothetical protein